MNQLERIQRLRHTDLNALVVLSVLLHEQGVSRAAELLSLSQPTVSRTLERLRSQFADPLLVRRGHHMVLTARARELLPLLEAFLDDGARILQTDVENRPETFSREVSIACSEYVQITIAEMLPAIRERSPGLSLYFRPMVAGRAGVAELSDGKIDLVIGLRNESMAEVRGVRLYCEPIVCLVRSEPGMPHPSGLTIAECCERPHLDVSPTGNRIYGARMDEAIRALGGSRNVAWSISSYMAAPQIVAQTDMISLVPQKIARQLRLPANVRIAELLFPAPEIEVVMNWHNVSHHDVVCAWLRAQIIDHCSRMSGDLAVRPAD